MHSLQQLIKASSGAVAAAGSSGSNGVNIANSQDLYKQLFKFLASARSVTSSTAIQKSTATTTTTTTPKQSEQQQLQKQQQQQRPQQQQRTRQQQNESSQKINNFNIAAVSNNLNLNVNGCAVTATTTTTKLLCYGNKIKITTTSTAAAANSQENFYLQGRNFHMQHNQKNGSVKQKQQSTKANHHHHHQQQHQTVAGGTVGGGAATGATVQQQQITQSFAMSSLAAEPLIATVAATNGNLDETTTAATAVAAINTNGSSCHDAPAVASSSAAAAAAAAAAGAIKKPCFNTGLAEILQFMELIGNLKHTKRTGWVLRDVNDCESISGHMYRMSMLTFLLDGSEGLNQIRCMELALVHDLAESLVGDITPFCGVSKDEKRAMEFKAMEDICKLIEPRGKRIMELFEEYEHGQSAESKFVKDLDRLDMVMQAFEYEKRDNCLLKHQEFFDSTEGKFNHPFVKKLVNEIYDQRKSLAKAKGATPPPPVHVPSMESNGHSSSSSNSTTTSSS